MMRLSVALATILTVIGGVPSAGAGPTQGGFASDNVRYERHVPFEAGTATGARLVGKHLFVTTWRSFSIYDVSDPLDPQLVSVTPVGVQFENEDVSSNGKILLFSEQSPGDVLHVWDVEDKSNPVEIAQVDGAGDHTHTCILSCAYSYGSDGSIIDLRRPTKAKQIGNWHELIGVKGGAHDVDEFRRGFIVTSPYRSGAIQLVDVRKPLRPEVVVSAIPHDVAAEPIPAASNVHSTRWPQQGRDRFLMAQGGSNLYQQRCDEDARNFWVFDASRWEDGGELRFLDEYAPGSGTVTDGKLPVSPLGCSPHWFEPHPDFRNGGLVTISYYDYGTRFLEIERNGKVSEVGWFVPYGGLTFSAYWLTDEIVYSIDASRGIDILAIEER